MKAIFYAILIVILLAFGWFMYSVGTVGTDSSEPVNIFEGSSYIKSPKRISLSSEFRRRIDFWSQTDYVLEVDDKFYYFENIALSDIPRPTDKKFKIYDVTDIEDWGVKILNMEPVETYIPVKTTPPPTIEKQVGKSFAW